MTERLSKRASNVYCPYCGNAAELVDSSAVYQRSYGMIWMCKPCDAYTGVHSSSPTFKPLGTLAKKELRALRRKAHALFDPMWQSKKMTRSEAYSQLAKLMNLPKEKTHVAMFSEDQCKEAIRVLGAPF